MTRVLRRLERPALVEATFELRFAPAPNVTGELLFGLIFASLKERYPAVARTGTAGLPLELRRSRPELRYLSEYRLEGQSVAVSLGDSVLTATALPPYPGWSKFREQCMQAVRVLSETGHVARVERFSLRYTNILPLQDGNPLDPLNIRIDLAGLPLHPDGFKLRFEKRSVPFVTVVECASRTAALISPSETREGLLFALDTIRQHDAGGFLQDPAAHLEKAHTLLEAIFLGLVSEHALEAMGPVWEQE
jgi:uncharacterized protein (TIGR04255 family)